MNRRLVTPISNFIDLGNGEFDLKDPDNFGILERAHALKAEARNPDTGEIQFGVVIKLEVSWNNKRVPAVDFVAPDEVAFVGFDKDLDADEDEDEDEDDDSDFDSFDSFSTQGADNDLT